jgi:hypothetical protein
MIPPEKVTVPVNAVTDFKVETHRDDRGRLIHTVTLQLVGSGVQVCAENGDVLASSGITPEFLKHSVVEPEIRGFDALADEIRDVVRVQGGGHVQKAFGRT